MNPLKQAKMNSDHNKKMDIVLAVKKRYTTKEYDATKKISDELFTDIKTLLRFSPSSTNIQPWHFVIANTESGKKRIAKGTEEGFSFNTPKVMDASHVIVFCAKTNLTNEDIRHVLDKEDEDGRFAKSEFKEQNYAGRKMFMDIHMYDLKDLQHWMEKQVYLNMGTVLLGAAALGIDATPMEGVNLKAIDEEFGLREKGYTSLAIVSLGYHKSSDFNAKLPKSRLPESEIFTLLS